MKHKLSAVSYQLTGILLEGTSGVEGASGVEAMQRGLGGFPHERLHQDTGILPVSCLFSGGQDAHSTLIHSLIQPILPNCWWAKTLWFL
ncbi:MULTISPECIES: hypothetical protein [unclassified Moorena]|uniref:hypothetical protein n=1 Tax=unclassified Moorena TaxID=2683338 RepID=UPI0013BC1B43|nr:MULTISPECIES: hypothetical protein [unclassified Moorena]NER89214.1 hypothetical protein [Moorena sp. SIO3A2]NET66599.1 hypothetical protein [Moorena sp. SIO1G6]